MGIESDAWCPSAHTARISPALVAVVVTVLLDPQSRRAALDAGDVDMILTTRASDIAEARDSDAVTAIEDSLTEETYVILNMSKPPFDNPHAREALAFATDVEGLIETTQAGIAVPATSPFAPGTAWAVDDAGYPEFDPDRAREAVAAYEADSGGSLSFTLGGLPVSDATEVQQLLQAQWAEVGIDAEIETLEQGAYISAMAANGFEAAWARGYSYTDPLYLCVFFHSERARGDGQLSTNFAQVKNAELDALLDEGLATDDEDRRREIYAEASRILNQEGADLWLFHTPFALLAQRDVAGLDYPREAGFASLEPKPWLAELWLRDG